MELHLTTEELALLHATFDAECQQLLDEMERTALALERTDDRTAGLQELLRAAHTIKGNSASCGLPAVSRYTHQVEESLQRMHGGAPALQPEVITRLLQVIDALREMIPLGIQGGAVPDAGQLQALGQLAAAVAGTSETAVHASPQHAGVPVAAPRALAASSSAATLRVGIEKLNRLLDLTGEIAIETGRARGELGACRVAEHQALVIAFEPLERLHLDLQELVLQLRMVPLAPLFQQHARTLRDLSRATGKEAELAIEAQGVEVDTAIAEQLRDPLTHMIRNALDHGIESAAERDAAGKSRVGRVTLRARHEGATVVIEVADDGAGLRLDRVRARAERVGLLAPGAAIDNAGLRQLLFEPGFTTADAVTELSGRGVGMDVVRRNIEALRGTIDLASVPGEGTTITIRLPLTVAIIDGFTVGVGDERYVIPLGAVTECIALDDDVQTTGAGTGVHYLRGTPLPFVRLRSLFGLGDAPPARESIVVLAHGDLRAGVVVDELRGEGQAVVKSLGPLLSRTPGVSGSTILGDGRVALILDVPSLLGRVATA